MTFIHYQKLAELHDLGHPGYDLSHSIIDDHKVVINDVTKFFKKCNLPVMISFNCNLKLYSEYEKDLEENGIGYIFRNWSVISLNYDDNYLYSYRTYFFFENEKDAVMAKMIL